MNHILLYKCLLSQNGKNGIKIKDYRVDIIGCIVKENSHAAIQVLEENDASATIYLKSKKNDKDFQGRILGRQGKYKPKTIIELN